MFESRTIFGRFFEGVDLDKVHQRGRFLPSQELQTLFPEDNEAGMEWVRSGRALATSVSSEDDRMV